ncbi:MAG: hypothetical protein H6739_29605 [Alphaproteobacteria bacterium]|nr:hypothetical protein [Alphaproteobacteria bacterium]
MSTILHVRPEAHRDALLALARAQGWPRVAEQVRSHTRSTIWHLRTPAGLIYWVEDHTLALRTVEVPDAATEALVRAALPIWSTEDLTALAASEDPREALGALRVLASLHTEGLPDTLRPIMEALIQHADPIARMAVARVALHGRWTSLLPLLRQQEQDDPVAGPTWAWVVKNLEAAAG